MSYACRIVGSEKTHQSRFFLLNALLQSRIEIGCESTDDEDVNVYLTALLHDFLEGKTSDETVSSFHADVAHAADRDDLRHRYRVYRANGDHALIATSLFDRPSLDRRRAADCRENDAAAARGSAYYGFAANLSERINRRHPAVAIVLRKLSDRFDTYAAILTHVRIDHLKLSARLSDAQIAHLQRSANEDAQPFLAGVARDRFLDAYSEWIKTGSEASRLKVNALGGELAESDRGFSFEPV